MKPGRSGDIGELVRLEKEEAGRSFESRRFDARLLKRIRDASEEKAAARPFFLRKPAPVIALSLLALAIAGFLFFRKPSASPFQQTVRMMSAVLSEAGDGQKPLERADVNQLVRKAEYTDFGWALKGAFFACERQALGDIDLANSLSLIFQKEAPKAFSPGDRKNLPATGVERPRLRTDEEYRTFFIVFLKKLEEV
jgi:hypothetical protein